LTMHLQFFFGKISSNFIEISFEGGARQYHRVSQPGTHWKTSTPHRGECMNIAGFNGSSPHNIVWHSPLLDGMRWRVFENNQELAGHVLLSTPPPSAVINFKAQSSWDESLDKGLLRRPHCVGRYPPPR
jgi:hypothetical protein